VNDLVIRGAKGEGDRAIAEMGGRFFATRAVVRHPREDSATRFQLDLVVADPDIPAHYFTKRQLETRKLKVPPGIIGGVRRF
jgi:hypothetical protein